MTILDHILETKRREVSQARIRRPLDELRSRIDSEHPPRGFAGSVLAKSAAGVQLIAEIKKSSPSAGLIVPEFDPVRIARAYADHGAAALSVLTDAAFFGGALETIHEVKRAVPLPVLRKDFLIDEYQMYESRAAGADAVLLIAEALADETLATLAAAAWTTELDVLVEVHTEENLQRVLATLGPPMREPVSCSPASRPGPEPPGCGSYLLGINNRDLAAQRVDLNTMTRLAKMLPAGTPFVAESGISTHDDVREAHRAGAGAVLVGEALLRSADIGAAVDRLLQSGAK